jgi:hypothetical protein
VIWYSSFIKILGGIYVIPKVVCYITSDVYSAFSACEGVYFQVIFSLFGHFGLTLLDDIKMHRGQHQDEVKLITYLSS